MRKKLLILFALVGCCLGAKAQLANPVTSLEDGEIYFIMNANTTLENRNFYFAGSNVRTHSTGHPWDIRFQAHKTTEENNEYWSFEFLTDNSGKWLGRSDNGENVVWRSSQSNGQWVINYVSEDTYPGFTMFVKGDEYANREMKMNGTAEWVVSYADGRDNDITANTSHWQFYKFSDFVKTDDDSFIASEWAFTGDGGRISQDKISVSDNQITLSGVTGDNNACLKCVTIYDYKFTRSAKAFVVTGSNLSTDGNKNYLWWQNGQAGNAYPATVTENGDGTVTLTWNVKDENDDYRNRVDGAWELTESTLFGLTPATPGADIVITDIHYELIPVSAYEFVASDWGSKTTDTNRVPSVDCYSVDAVNNTLTIRGYSTTNDNGQHNVALTFSCEKYYQFARSAEKLIVKGRNLSTTLDDSHLWWVNHINPNASRLPAYSATTDGEGLTTITWDLTEIPVENRTAITGAWGMDGALTGFTTVFGLTPADDTQPVVITDIDFTMVDETAMHNRTMEVGKFGTICLPRRATTTQATIYSVAAIYNGNLSLTPLASDAAMEAGVPYFFQATEANPSFTMIGDAVTEPVATLGLVGTFERIAIPAGDYHYVLNDNKLYQVDENDKAYVGANRAYIDLEAVSESLVKAAGTIDMELVNFNATALQSVKTAETSALIYDLQGRRVQNMQGKHGIYIQNGKKILVK